MNKNNYIYEFIPYERIGTIKIKAVTIFTNATPKVNAQNIVKTNQSLEITVSLLNNLMLK